MNLQEKLLKIQQELKAPKNQYNSFGNYKYRNAEDILEAVKPLLRETKTVLTISDDIEALGDHAPVVYKEKVWNDKAKEVVEETRVEGMNRLYVKATIYLHDTESTDFMVTTACARESDTKKGMDNSQMTGAASSYARKYALNGMFAIDDTKDSDTEEYQQHQKTEEKPTPKAAGKLATPNQLKLIKEKYTVEELAELTKVTVEDLEKHLPKLTMVQASKMIQNKIGEK